MCLMAAYLDLATNIGFSALIPRRVAGKRKIWKETGLGDLRQPRKMAVTPPHTHTHYYCVPLLLARHSELVPIR